MVSNQTRPARLPVPAARVASRSGEVRMLGGRRHMDAPWTEAFPARVGGLPAARGTRWQGDGARGGRDPARRRWGLGKLPDRGEAGNPTPTERRPHTRPRQSSRGTGVWSCSAWGPGTVRVSRGRRPGPPGGAQQVPHRRQGPGRALAPVLAEGSPGADGRTPRPHQAACCGTWGGTRTSPVRGCVTRDCGPSQGPQLCFSTPSTRHPSGCRPGGWPLPGVRDGPRTAGLGCGAGRTCTHELRAPPSPADSVLPAASSPGPPLGTRLRQARSALSPAVSTYLTLVLVQMTYSISSE